MSAFTSLLRNNRNYRATWAGQCVSEIGDHFNNIAVLSLAMEHSRPGLVVTGVFLARAVPMLAAGPIAGVLLDRLDRKRVMIASDLARAVIALGFILCIHRQDTGLLYGLSALLMFASPFFTSGRSSILPNIATPAELHTANTMTQTTSWAAITIGAFLGAVGTAGGYEFAFLFNALSFVISAFCISRLKREGGFRPAKPNAGVTSETQAVTSETPAKESGLTQYREGLRYMRATPLVAGVALLSAGWASGGGAAQILFSLFGEKVFNRGAWGIGFIWGWAGIGLLLGASIAYRLGKRLSFGGYKRTVAIVYLIHGGAYVVFSQMPRLWQACFFIMISRAGISISSVLNYSQLLHHVEDRYRGRVFATLESITWSVMMLSMMAAGAASTVYSPRTIGAWAGTISASTAIFWLWANWSGRLPEPVRHPVAAMAEGEVQAEPPVTS